MENELFEGLEFGTMTEPGEDFIEVPETLETNEEQEQAASETGTEGVKKPEIKDKKEPGMPKELQDLLIDIDDKEKETEEDEKNKKTDEKSQDKDTSSQSSDSSPSSSKFKMLAKALSDEGVLSEITDEEWSELVENEGDDYKALVALQKKEIEKGISEYKSSLTDEERAIYEGKEAGVNLGELGQLDNALKVYKSISDDALDSDEASDDLKKAIIAEDLKIRGFSDDEVKEEIQLYEDTDKLTSKAKTSKKKLISHIENERTSLIEVQKQQQTKNREEYENKIKELKNNIYNKEELIPGIKLTPKAKEDIYKSMTTPVAEKDGVKIDALRANREKNPEMFDMVVHYLNSIGLLNFDKDGNYKPDLSKLEKKSRSTAAKELEDALKTDTFDSKSKDRSPKDNWFSLSDAL